MLSRIADSLFWLNRYMERADGLLRLTGTHYILSLDKDVNGSFDWKPVLEIFTAADNEEIENLKNNTDGVLKKMLIDAGNQNSLKSIINRARENARGVQDHITKEVWEEVNQMYHMVNQPSLHDQLSSYKAIDVIDQFTKRCVLYTGTISTTMPRGTGWDFMSLGKFLERGLQTIALLQKQLELARSNTDEETNDILFWRYLLFSLSGYELHLKTYQSSNHSFNVLHQVVLNERFSRSILYSLAHVSIFLSRVANKEDKEGSFLLRSFGRIHSKVNYMDLELLNENSLEEFLNELEGELFTFSNLLGQHFFSYS